jgi:putative membrane protein
MGTISNRLTKGDCLAIERTKLANQRTGLAYVRTALMMCVTGVTVLKFFAEDQLLRIAGAVTLLLALVVLILGALIYLKEASRLKNNHPKSKG